MDIGELKNIFENCEIKNEKIIIKSGVAKTLKFIQQNYGFDMLKEIVATDTGEGAVELTYRLYSTRDDEDVLIASYVTEETESVSGIYDSAYADEKEIYDLFGIKFTGNNELKRLYMPESWQGHPLRKDYKEDDERLRWNE